MSVKNAARVAILAVFAAAIVATFAIPGPAPNCGAHSTGSMGLCLPHAHNTPPGFKLNLIGETRFQDRSNNNPCDCGTLIRSAGMSGLIVKANQGEWVDPTGAAMIASARKAGLAVGLYDFDWTYTIAEARVLAAVARADGIPPGAHNTFPLTLDVEAGSFSYAGLLAQIHYLYGLGYRVQIYTGDWYWGPHAGCRWPPVTAGAWLSGYPAYVPVCGLPTRLIESHQYTETPIDISVYLGTSFADYVNAAPPPPPPPPPSPPSKLPRWKRALDATALALLNVDRGLQASGCVVPYRRGVCIHLGAEARVLDQRFSYFANQILKAG